MRYFVNLLSFKRPKTQGLLDIALILSLVPHLFVLKVLMFVYLFAAFLLILKKRRNRYDFFSLFSFGLFVLLFSFLSNYNFSDFSRMQFFVSFISSLLIFAFTLQRLSGEINFYLKISPVLLMLLSFFFFDTLSMLFYSLFVFFVFVLLSIWSRMDANLGELLRFNSALFLLSLPAVVILFIVFPRISFEKAEFGFRAEGYNSGEFDGSMYVGEKPFLPSNRVVMEVFFDKEMPLESSLYFRGSVLHPKDASLWEHNATVKNRDRLIQESEPISYTALIYPHAKRWLYALDMPIEEEYKKTQLQNEQTLLALKEIYEKKRYRFKAALHYRLLASNTEHYLEHNLSSAPKSALALKQLREAPLSLDKKAEALLDFFKNQKLSYTIEPKNIDTKNITDSFLFEAKNGYCTHFASSFAYTARMIGIPSRVVSGYKGDNSNRIENYLIIKQKDAHAWVELYLDEAGWVRIDPTTTAFRNLDTSKEQTQRGKNELFEALNLHYMYVTYLINNWVLGFDRLKQMAILDSILNDTLVLLEFIFWLFMLFILSFVLFYLLGKTHTKDKLQRVLKPLYKFLAKKGVYKKSAESFECFMKRAQQESGVNLEEINELYHSIKYAKKEVLLLVLQKAIKSLETQK